MGRLKVKGKAGAAKNYVTRSAAVKKLQCSLADFRRLCILKGIFPREPRSRKKANKGSSAPTSFYYAKDIAYLAHEPVLKKLREHKAFAKKLARALGRGEWSSAKSLEENKPIYRLDHIVKERYPTFIDAVRDIDDALCMIFLFATLPCDGRLPKEIIENCSRLAAEWQLYLMHTMALRKVFLSIKGVYFQAEVLDQTVNWLTPYQFTQNIPADVDVRVMLTFLELYQTLLSFVFFKLYTDVGLVYPPPLDLKKDEGGAGIDALHITTSSRSVPAFSGQVFTAEGRSVSAKDVRQTIKAIDVNPDEASVMDGITSAPITTQIDEEFVPRTSTDVSRDAVSTLPTLQTISALPQTTNPNLFSSFTFWLSREVSRSIFEFVVRSFGGRIGWPPSSGGGSPFGETDPTITHVITDRPVVDKKADDSIGRELCARRKYIQPQWIVDCVNAGKILLEDAYGQGKILPPHLSPFGENEGAHIPLGATEGQQADEVESMSEDGDEVDHAVANVVASGDPTALLAAELQAEAAGVDYAEFEAEVQRAIRKRTTKTDDQLQRAEHDMNKMMMSSKQRKLYEKMKHSQQKKTAERLKLEQRRKDLLKQARKRLAD